MTGRWRAQPSAAIALLAIISSAVGIVNRFPYDDRYIVELNPATRDLHRWWNVFTSSYWPKSYGGDGYRPLTMLAFRIEWALGRGSPVVFHAANILLYAAVSVLVYVLARQLLPEWAAWATAALYAVHPVHVEAVAGVVGQSELLVAAALLAAVVLYLRDRARGDLQPRTIAQIALLYIIGCFSKEHGIVLPALLVAAELTVVNDGVRVPPDSSLIRRLRPFYLLLTLIAVAFVAIRSRVLADHGLGGFEPFTPFSTLHITNGDRMLTALGVVPEWLRLFYWPAHLSAEYGPPDIQIAQGVGLWQLPGLVLLLAILSLAVVLRRQRPAISFGIAFVCISLLPSSNFVIPAGIVLAERTLLLPSVGALLVAGGLFVAIAEYLRTRDRSFRWGSRAAAAVCGIALLTGAVRSSQRTKVWHDNETLFQQSVIDSPFAYRAHYMLGAWDFEKKRKRLGEAEYRRALELFPYDAFLAYNLAEQYRRAGLCGPAIPLYEWSHNVEPRVTLGDAAYAECLLNEDRFDDAKAKALEAISAGASAREMRRLIFLADSVKAAGSRRQARRSAAAEALSGKMPHPLQKTANKVAVPITTAPAKAV